MHSYSIYLSVAFHCTFVVWCRTILYCAASLRQAHQRPWNSAACELVAQMGAAACAPLWALSDSQQLSGPSMLSDGFCDEGVSQSRRDVLVAWIRSVDDFSSVQSLQLRYSFSVPTREALHAVAAAAKNVGLVSCGAGRGFWEALLATCSGGVDVLAFDGNDRYAFVYDPTATHVVSCACQHSHCVAGVRGSGVVGIQAEALFSGLLSLPFHFSVTYFHWHSLNCRCWRGCWRDWRGCWQLPGALVYARVQWCLHATPF